MREKGRHSGESRNPVAVLLNNSIFLDARFRGHDELRHSLFTKGGKGGFSWFESALRAWGISFKKLGVLCGKILTIRDKERGETG
jgi:hypothetical protein